MRNIASLFDRDLDVGDLDQVYKHIRDSTYCEEERTYLDKAWRACRENLDRHFVNEIRRPGNFHSRTWELRLAWTLLDVGLPFTMPKPGPDFAVQLEGRTAFIEAVAPKATAFLLDNYRQAQNGGAPLPDDAIILRFTSAIDEKLRKYAEYRQTGIIGADAPYVIALSGGNIPQSSIETEPFPRILCPLFAIGPMYFNVQLGGEAEVTTGLRRLADRRTVSGGSVHCGIFLEDGRRELSAVVFAAEHIKNRPESQGRPPGSDFLIIHNPHATNPLPEGVIPRGCEWGGRDGHLEMIADWRPGNAA